MAAAYQSSASTDWASTASLVITKPTGVVVGDLLIAVTAFNGGSARSVTPPAGWTAITQVNQSTEVGLATFWKIATSTETAASDFTFTISSAEDCAGGMLRISGHSASAPIFTSAGNSVANTQNPDIANTITPAVANSLLVMVMAGRDTNGSTITDYAIATSNPSWTEAFEEVAGGTGWTLGVAYATRPETTATGNSSAAAGTADGSTDWVGLMIAIPENVDFTVTDTVTGTDTFTTSIEMTFLDTVTATDSFSSSIARLWANLVRNIKTWTNQDK